MTNKTAAAQALANATFKTQFEALVARINRTADWEDGVCVGSTGGAIPFTLDGETVYSLSYDALEGTKCSKLSAARSRTMLRRFEIIRV